MLIFNLVVFNIRRFVSLSIQLMRDSNLDLQEIVLKTLSRRTVGLSQWGSNGPICFLVFQAVASV